MARKNVVPGYSMFGTAGANMHSTAAVTSNVTEVQNLDNLGVVIDWAGTSPVGALTIDVSNDNLTWDSLDFGATIDIANNSGTHLLTINQLPYSYVRATYTNASGTGTLNATLTIKQVGG